MIKYFQILPKTNFDFIASRKKFFIFSAALMLACLGAVIFKGMNYGLDFTGGSMVQVQFNDNIGIGDLRKALQTQGINADIQTFVGRNAFAVKVKGGAENADETFSKIEAGLKATNVSYQIEQRDFVGPTVGNHLAKKALFAFVISMSAMLVYIGFRFSNIVWGAMTVTAMVHDVFLAVGVFAVLQLEVDLVIVAAFLTVAGFTINSTIVVFDRVRENISLNPKADLKDVLNQSVNETLSRTIITTGTVALATTILLFMGGHVLRNFSLAILIGIICGAYTTACLAPGLVYQWVKGGNYSLEPAPVAQQPAQQQGYAAPKKKNKKRYG